MKVRKANINEWDDFVNKCPRATFFHTPQWYQIWHEYAGYGIDARIIEFKSGRKALLPLSWRKRAKGLMKEYISSPAGTYGGFIVNDILSEDEIIGLQNYINAFTSIQIRENPFKRIFTTEFPTREDFTQVLYLSQGLETILKEWSKNHKRSLNKAVKNELIVSEASIEKDWIDYFHAYQDSLKRWGKSATNNYQWALFKAFQKISHDKCKLWTVKFQGNLVSGCICFYHNKHIVYWHGATFQQFFNLRPTHILHCEIIKNAIEKKYLIYDFNPSGGHERVVKFKKGFGTTKVSANIYLRNSIKMNLLNKFSRIIHR